MVHRALVERSDMQVATSLLPNVERISDDTDVAVVIDVLRATSVMATALEAGCERIVTCREVAEAKDVASQWSPRPLLCGERGCRRIDGFDLGNSPAEYDAARVAGKTLVLTTTNGTRAIDAAANASRVLTASFLNLSAVIDALQETRCLHLVCAGTEGEITAEDALLAGAILIECETRYGAETVGDDSVLARQLWRSWFGDCSAGDVSPGELSRRLRETRGGRNLVRLGFEDDLDRCAAVNSLKAVPERIDHSPATFGLLAN